MANYDKETTTIQFGNADKKHIKIIQDFYQFSFMSQAVRRAIESLAAAIEIEQNKKEGKDKQND